MPQQRHVELCGFIGTQADLNGKLAKVGALNKERKKYAVTLEGSSEPIFVAAHHLMAPSRDGAQSPILRGRMAAVRRPLEHTKATSAGSEFTEEPGAPELNTQHHKEDGSAVSIKTEDSARHGSILLMHMKLNDTEQNADECAHSSSAVLDNVLQYKTSQQMEIFRKSLRAGCAVESSELLEETGIGSNKGGKWTTWNLGGCERCRQKLIKGISVVELDFGKFHKKCFTCMACTVVLVGVPWKGDWMQASTTLLPRSDGIFCVGCFNSKFEPDCSGCGRKMSSSRSADGIFSIRGKLDTYCSESCMETEKKRVDEEEKRTRAEREHREQIAAQVEQIRNASAEAKAEAEAVAEEQEKRAESAAVLEAAAGEKREKEEMEVIAAQHKRERAEAAAAVAQAAHASWTQNLANIEQAERNRSKPTGKRAARSKTSNVVPNIEEASVGKQVQQTQWIDNIELRMHQQKTAS